jgi:hypothetical protein
MPEFYFSQKVCLKIEAQTEEEALAIAERWQAATNQRSAKLPDPDPMPDDVKVMVMAKPQNITVEMQKNIAEVEAQQQEFFSPYLREGEDFSNVTLSELWRRMERVGEKNKH